MHAPNEVILPALGISQDTGKIIRWLVAEGQPVKQGEPLLEIETDKAVAEIEAPATGILREVKAQAGDDVPVGTVIAIILPPAPADAPPLPVRPVTASPLAARMAADHHVDLALIRPEGGRVKQADVLAYLQTQEKTSAPVRSTSEPPLRTLASPKARRLAAEGGISLAALRGSGPEGAVLASDVLAHLSALPQPAIPPAVPPAPLARPGSQPEQPPAEITPGNVWRIMAERTTAAWREAPHFFLLRDVDATRLSAWREAVQKNNSVKVTYTDLLVKVVAAALRQHPRINAVYQSGKIRLLPEINVGVAVAVEGGLVVPVICKADEQSVGEIAALRTTLVEKARMGRLRPEDISGGTFTLSNLGMYNVDAFLAIINPPQSAILAVGRIAERVVPVRRRPAVRPMMTLSLSCDHRVVDGALGAQFLDMLARLIEEPLGLIS